MSSPESEGRRVSGRNAEIICRRKAGEGPRAIAGAMGLSHGVVSGVLFRAGLTDGSGAGIGRPSRRVPQHIRELICASAARTTRAEAASAWGVHPATITVWCRSSPPKQERAG